MWFNNVFLKIKNRKVRRKNLSKLCPKPEDVLFYKNLDLKILQSQGFQFQFMYGLCIETCRNAFAYLKNLKSS